MAYTPSAPTLRLDGDPTAQVINPNAKPASRILIGLMGVFFGWCGIHRFLLGNYVVGVIQILVTLMTFGFGGIWGTIEGFMVLFQAKSFRYTASGRPVR
ncbi:TM2 domain-containing protein [Dermabacteraceae bacterium P13115]